MGRRARGSRARGGRARRRRTRRRPQQPGSRSRAAHCVPPRPATPDRMHRRQPASGPRRNRRSRPPPRPPRTFRQVATRTRATAFPSPRPPRSPRTPARPTHAPSRDPWTPFAWRSLLDLGTIILRPSPCRSITARQAPQRRRQAPQRRRQAPTLRDLWGWIPESRRPRTGVASQQASAVGARGAATLRGSWARSRAESRRPKTVVASQQASGVGARGAATLRGRGRDVGGTFPNVGAAP